MFFLFNNIFIYVNMIIGDSMKKYILTILITAIICITGTVIASNYLASEITYNDTTVENALNDLYTRTDATITGLNTQVTNLTNEKDELENQLNSLTTASKSFTFTSGTSPVTINLGFKAGYISCVANNIGASSEAMVTITYNKDFNSTKAIRVSVTADSCNQNATSATTPISNWFTINDTSITWNIAQAAWSGKTIYCTASK